MVCSLIRGSALIHLLRIHFSSAGTPIEGQKCTCSTEAIALGHVAGAAVETDAIGLAAVAPVPGVAGITVARGSAVRADHAPARDHIVKKRLMGNTASKAC